MSGQFSNSPRGEDKDVEAGTSSFTDYEDSPFDITRTKNAPVERLRRWRIEKVVVVTKEEYTTEAREILKAKNAIFYISYKYNGDSSRGWAGDHKATIRKTMDGKPGHMCLEVASYRTEEEEEEEKREIAKFMAVLGHNP